jgi:hypothetical protein
LINVEWLPNLLPRVFFQKTYKASGECFENFRRFDDNNPNCFNTACTNSGQSCNPVLTSCGSGTCGGASKVEFSNVSLRKVKSYFYLDNDNIDDSTCNGQVSKNNGCILFDDVNDSNKTYNS